MKSKLSLYRGRVAHSNSGSREKEFVSLADHLIDTHTSFFLSSRHIDVSDKILAVQSLIINCIRMTPRGSFAFALKGNTQAFP